MVSSTGEFTATVPKRGAIAIYANEKPVGNPPSSSDASRLGQHGLALLLGAAGLGAALVL